MVPGFAASIIKITVWFEYFGRFSLVFAPAHTHTLSVRQYKFFLQFERMIHDFCSSWCRWSVVQRRNRLKCKSRLFTIYHTRPRSYCSSMMVGYIVRCSNKYTHIHTHTPIYTHGRCSKHYIRCSIMVPGKEIYSSLPRCSKRCAKRYWCDKKDMGWSIFKRVSGSFFITIDRNAKRLWT